MGLCGSDLWGFVGLIGSHALLIRLHGRLTSRAWSADQYLNRLYKQYVVAKDSLVSMVENSNLLGEKFKRYVRRSAGVYGIQVSNLSLARHRADSTQKPLARLVLYIDALFAVAMDVSNSRSGREAQVAENFLQMGTEEYLQLAMMADAGDEAIQVVRLCDSESFDPATTPAEVAGFRARIKHLFIERGCLELHGFTHFAVGVLTQQRVYTSRRQGLRLRFGCGPQGPPLGMVTRCLERMHGWCVIATSVLDAEFPDFELLQSFSVFNLGGGPRGSAGISGGGAEHPRAFSAAQLQHVDRLAKTFGVCPLQLQQEIADFRPLADAAMSTGCSAQEAWRVAVQKVMRSDQRVQDSHPFNALVPVLIRWLTLVCTTSAIEQGFAKMLHSIRAQQRPGPNAESDAAKCVLDWDAQEEPQVLERARRVWASHYGKTRQWRGSRMDKGAARPLAEFDEGSARNSEISFLRARRLAVRRAAARADSLDSIPLPGRWTAEQAAEVTFQQKKREHRRLQALQEGTLADSEITVELEQANAALQKSELAKERKRNSEHERRAALGAGRRLSREDLEGKAVWVEAGVSVGISGGSAAFNSALRKLRMRQVDERCQACAAPEAVSCRHADQLFVMVAANSHLGVLRGWLRAGGGVPRG